MRAWTVDGTGAPTEVLKLREVDPPEPGPGFVRLRVAAAGVGLPDVLMCAGTYPLTPARPFTPGQEVAGTVTAVGEGVDPSLVGSRRMGVTAFYLGSGGFADECLAAEATVYPAPVWIDDAAAAGFHVPFHTAWVGLVDRAGVAADEDVVVLGAAGGSGSAAVLVAGALGARVIAIAGGPEKVEYCRSLGADVVIDHRDVDLATAITDATEGRGAAVVFDPVGAATGEAAATVMANAGRFLLVGFAGGRWPTIDPARVVRGNFSVMGVYAGAYDRATNEAVYSELFALIEAGQLSTVPPTAFDFDELPAALEAVADRRVLGKQILRVGATP